MKLFDIIFIISGKRAVQIHKRDFKINLYFGNNKILFPKFFLQFTTVCSLELLHSYLFAHLSERQSADICINIYSTYIHKQSAKEQSNVLQF